MSMVRSVNANLFLTPQDTISLQPADQWFDRPLKDPVVFQKCMKAKVVNTAFIKTIIEKNQPAIFFNQPGRRPFMFPLDRHPSGRLGFDFAASCAWRLRTQKRLGDKPHSPGGVFYARLHRGGPLLVVPRQWPLFFTNYNQFQLLTQQHPHSSEPERSCSLR